MSSTPHGLTPFGLPPRTEWADFDPYYIYPRPHAESDDRFFGHDDLLRKNGREPYKNPEDLPIAQQALLKRNLVQWTNRPIPQHILFPELPDVYDDIGGSPMYEHPIHPDFTWEGMWENFWRTLIYYPLYQFQSTIFPNLAQYDDKGRYKIPDIKSVLNETYNMYLSRPVVGLYEFTTGTLLRGIEKNIILPLHTYIYKPLLDPLLSLLSSSLSSLRPFTDPAVAALRKKYYTIYDRWWLTDSDFRKKIKKFHHFTSLLTPSFISPNSSRLRANFFSGLKKDFVKYRREFTHSYLYPLWDWAYEKLTKEWGFRDPYVRGLRFGQRSFTPMTGYLRRHPYYIRQLYERQCQADVVHERRKRAQMAFYNRKVEKIKQSNAFGMFQYALARRRWCKENEIDPSDFDHLSTDLTKSAKWKRREEEAKQAVENAQGLAKSDAMARRFHSRFFNKFQSYPPMFYPFEPLPEIPETLTEEVPFHNIDEYQEFLRQKLEVEHDTTSQEYKDAFINEPSLFYLQLPQSQGTTLMDLPKYILKQTFLTAEGRAILFLLMVSWMYGGSVLRWCRDKFVETLPFFDERVQKWMWSFGGGSKFDPFLMDDKSDLSATGTITKLPLKETILPDPATMQQEDIDEIMLTAPVNVPARPSRLAGFFAL